MKKRFIITIEKEDLRKINAHIIQETGGEIIPDDFTDTVKELFYLGMLDLREMVDIEEIT